MDILDALRDLHQQATTHYVASTCKKAIAEIEKLRAALRLQNKSALGGVAQAPIDPTNHHNALKCPYCNPNDAVRKAVIEECARKVVQISVLADQFRCAFGLGLAESIRGLSVPSASRATPCDGADDLQHLDGMFDDRERGS